MCLIVEKVPKKNYFQRVRKYMTYGGLSPYQRTKTKNGWLIKKDNKKKYHIADRIGAGHIHSFNTKTIIQEWRKPFNSYVNKAYAFNIKATGDGEIVSKAIYIPRLDNSKNKEETLKKIDKIKKYKREGKLTVEKIVKLFPELEKSFKDTK